MMKKMEVGKKLLALSLGWFSMALSAQNPIVQTHYTADPAPMVYRDTLYLYVGCDEKDAPRNAYLMREYRLYTTTDMVNWTDHGAVLRTSAFDWSAGDASAAQCIERNGKFYWYISSQNKFKPGSSIGVAVGDTPYGPFKDALGRALVTNDMTTYAKHSWDDLDPSVFVDKDGQAWLYWGNGVCYRVKLKDDMVSSCRRRKEATLTIRASWISRGILTFSIIMMPCPEGTAIAVRCVWKSLFTVLTGRFRNCT